VQRTYVHQLLEELSRQGILKSDPAQLVERFEITADDVDLADRRLVIESIIESLDAKKESLRRVEEDGFF
jgi:3-hydroxyacyl-CoA dehydrogenase